MSDSVAQDMIQAFFDRWQRLEEEKAAISGDLKELFAEAKANGFDTKVLRVVFRDKVADQAEKSEFEAVYDLYWSALGTPRATGARPAQGIPEHDADGVIIESTAARKDVRHAGALAKTPQLSDQGTESGSGSTRPGGEQAGIESRPSMLFERSGGALEARLSPKQEVAGSSPAQITNLRAAEESTALAGVATSSAGTEGEADRQPIHESVTTPTAASLPAEVTVPGDGERTDSAPDAFPGATNVTAFRHNPKTHFLNSKGLPRLHGCLKPEVCGGTHRALCFSCSVQHEGPAYSDGAA